MMLDAFNTQFPTEDACLEYLCKKRFPRKRLKRVKGRKAFYDRKGGWYWPLKGTIFERSRTPLKSWFYAIYLFSVSKNGISAAEIQRHLGVTYKCAWRMGHQIRKVMVDDGPKLCGVVEADETYLGKRRSGTQTCIVGAVERGGRIRAKVTPNRREESVIPFLEKNVRKGSRLMTDEAQVYKTTMDFKHRSVNHSKYQWVRKDVHTNHIEGFWGHLKRTLRGTYQGVSRQHLQAYINHQAFLYNNRERTFEALLDRI